MMLDRRCRSPKAMQRLATEEGRRRPRRRSLLRVEQLENRVVPSILIPVPNHRDLVYDHFRNLLDITTSDGTIKQFNVTTQTALETLEVGTSLYGADIAPDGSALYVADSELHQLRGVVHKVNLSSGQVTSLLYNVVGSEGGSWDVIVGSSGIGLVTTVSNVAGHVPLRQLNLSTDALSLRTDDPGSGQGGQIGGSTLLHRSADRKLVFLTEANVATGPVFTYSAATNAFSESVHSNAELTNALSAVNRDGTLLALEREGSVEILDPSFRVVTSLPNLDGGVIFDPTVDVLYAVSSATSQVVAYDTNTWTVKFQMPIGEETTAAAAFGNGVMAVSDDGSWLFLSTPSGVRAFNLPARTGPAVTLGVNGFPQSISAGVAGSFTVTVRDAGGTTATDYRGTVHFTSSDPLASLPRDYTFTEEDAGTHTFTATLKTAGHQSIVATDVQTSSLHGAQDSDVLPAAIANYRVEGPADPQPSGHPFNVTVTARDAYNNTIIDYAGTAHFSCTDGAGSLPGDYTFTETDHGVHTFSVTLQTSGNQTITATDTGNSAITGSANVLVDDSIRGLTFTISPSVTATTAGTPFSVTVTAFDENNAVATRYRGTIHFTTGDAGRGVVLPGDYTFTSEDNGVHVFTGVILVTAGPEVVGFKDTALLVGASTTVTITPAAATTFRVTGFPLSIMAGVAGTFTVTALDAYGNVATGYGGTVHCSSSDAHASLPGDAALHDGTGSFSATLKTVGVQSLTATDTADATITGVETGITVTAAAATHFRVSAPTTATAGVSFPVTVTALDSFENLATDYRGTVHLTSSDTKATLPPDYAFTEGDRGAHGFVVNLNTAGSQSVTATDTGNGIAGTQASITVNPAERGRIILSGYPTPQTAGVPGNFTVLAVDTFGNTLTNYTGTVVFSSSDGQAVLPPAYTFTTADHGTHTFPATLKTVGIQSLTATDKANGLTSTQGDIQVNPAAADQLILSGFPSPTMAGAAGSFTVTVKDTYGNTVTNYAGTVVFGSSDAQAVLPAGYTFTPADHGVHSFPATLKTAGVQTLTGIDRADGFRGKQENITVRPAAVSGLAIFGFPATTTAGASGGFTVAAKDAFGNTVAGFTGTAVFSSSDGLASLPPAYTFTPADNGVHTFTGTLKTVGLQSLTASDKTDGLSATQSGIIVRPAPVSQLVIFGFPSPTMAGTAAGFTVTAKDGFGNTVTGFTGTVTFGSSDLQADLPNAYAFTPADNGTHSFTATLKTAGPQSLSAIDKADGLSGTQASITVSPAAVSQLAISAPSGTFAGVPATFTVTAKDPYGNTATDYLSTVAFGSSDPQAALPATYTFTPGDNGTHTFTAVMKTTGSQLLAASDADNGFRATQGTITVSPVVISKLDLIAPNLAGMQTGMLAADDAYIGALYQDLLNRPVDSAGLVHWVQLLMAGVSRQQIAMAFWQSPEHRGIEVDQYYATYLNRSADAAGRMSWVNAFLGGASEVDVIGGFLTSAEYQATHGSDASFVNGLYSQVLGRAADSAGQAVWLQALQNGVSRQAVAQAFLTSREADQRLVDMYYTLFLHRAPDAAGEQMWTDALVSGRETYESLGEKVLASDEYFRRVTQV